MQTNINMHPVQFSLFRILTGIYFGVHFIQLLPFAAEMYSNQGMLAEAQQNPTSVLFPFNILNYWDDVFIVKIFLIVLTLASVLLMLGIKRKWMSVILLYGWICLFNRNNLTLEPGMGYMGWFLAIMIFIEKGEPLSLLGKTDSGWQLPQIVYACSWLLMGLGYTLSGIDKCFSPSWVDGTAIHHLTENPLMNDNILVTFLENSPSIIHEIITYFILILEILFLPLSFFPKARPFIWTGMVIVHLFILIMMNMADLSFSMLLLHVFTFDFDWLTLRNNKLKTKAL